MALGTLGLGKTVRSLCDLATYWNHNPAGKDIMVESVGSRQKAKDSI